MAKESTKALNERIKAAYLEKVIEMFTESGEEVLRTASNEIAIPVVDKEGNEKWVVCVVKIPTGTRQGEEYDGYSTAEDYQMKQEAKRAKAEAKAEKAAKDKAKREAKAKEKKEEEQDES